MRPAAASHTSRTDPRLAALVAALASGALLALALWGASPAGRYLHHDYRPSGAVDQVAAIALFPLGWTLMCAAMMLPTAIALLREFDAAVVRRPERTRLRIRVLAGFLAVWALVGCAFRGVDVLVHWLVGSLPWLAARPELIGASAVVLAGAFELSPFKRRCLTACRTPRSFLIRRWHGRAPRVDALRIGMDYGVSCAGCCWALMFVMFALGMANLAWMLGFAAVMALEKNSRMGVRAVPVAAAGLISAGLVVGLG